VNSRALGVSGTRNPLSLAQYDQMVSFIRSWRTQYDELHHGCCIGADESIALTASLRDYFIIGHPPINEQFLSSIAVALSNKLMPAQEYLDRNHNIVDATAMLLALPISRDQILRSGTWSTIRYARTKNRPITIIYPDGTVELENMGLES
jgi:hypothetical protein